MQDSTDRPTIEHKDKLSQLNYNTETKNKQTTKISKTFLRENDYVVIINLLCNSATSYTVVTCKIKLL